MWIQLQETISAPSTCVVDYKPPSRSREVYCLAIVASVSHARFSALQPHIKSSHFEASDEARCLLGQYTTPACRNSYRRTRPCGCCTGTLEIMRRDRWPSGTNQYAHVRICQWEELLLFI